MVRSTIITEKNRLSICRKLREYIGRNTETSEYSNGIEEEPLNPATLDRLIAFRYIPRCEEWRAALKRLAEGTYGSCMICHEPISGQELKVDPLARFCCKCERELSSADHERDRPRQTLVS